MSFSVEDRILIKKIVFR